MRIGVLALQGAFRLHQFHLEALGIEYVEVVTCEQLESLDGLILPGGESAVMLNLIGAVGIQTSLESFVKQKPTWGICAGAILMAKTVKNPAQFSFGALAIEVERNAYGRQLESSHENIEGYQVSYIRAPKITKVDPSLRIRSARDGFPTWAESASAMVTTFHPETNLNFPSPWHRRFAELARVASGA